MQNIKIFVRNVLLYFLPFFIMTVIAIISQDYIFRMLQDKNYEIIRNQLLRDFEEIEEEIYSGRSIALEMSKDDNLSKENLEELGILSIKAINRIGEYRIRFDICSSIFMTYSPEKIVDENGITSLNSYCEFGKIFSNESAAVFKSLLEARESSSCVLETIKGAKSILFLYYFSKDFYDEERWVGFYISEDDIKKRLSEILGDIDSLLILTYKNDEFLNLNQLSKELSKEMQAYLHDIQGKKDNKVPGYIAMLHHGKISDMKMHIIIDDYFYTRTVRQEQIKIVSISIISFAVLAFLLWRYGTFQVKKIRIVRQLALDMYPEMNQQAIKGEYDLIRMVLQKDSERLECHDQMLKYFQKESRRQLIWLLLKTTPPEAFQIEDLIENCGIDYESSYFAVLDFVFEKEDNFSFIENVDGVVMCHSEKSDLGSLLIVVVRLKCKDEKHNERLMIAEKILQELREKGICCKGIACGLVYEQLKEIHSSQEEAYSLLIAQEGGRTSELTSIIFFDEMAKVSGRISFTIEDGLLRFRDAMLEESNEKAIEVLGVLLRQSKGMRGETLTYVRYKVIQMVMELCQEKDADRDLTRALINLVNVENDEFEIEIKRCIEQLNTHTSRLSIDENDVLDHIEKHALDSEISVDSIADYFGIHESTVRRIVKDKANKPYKEYIVEIRLNKACELLEENNLSIQEIACQVGYYNVTSFNRLFKRICGMSPREYRTLKNR